MVQRGRSVVFECKVKHDPSLTPTMTWLKDDGELPDDERSELFANVSFLKPLTLRLLSLYISFIHLGNLTFNDLMLS